MELLAKKITILFKSSQNKEMGVIGFLDSMEKHNPDIRSQRKVDSEIYNSMKKLCTLDYVRGREVHSGKLT